MRQHPKAKEHTSYQLTPLRYHRVYRPADTHRNRDQIHHHDRYRRYHQRTPSHYVQFRKLVVHVITPRLGR